MYYNIRLFEVLDIDTDIDWWNTNRKKINEAIKMVNDWQINNRQDVYEGELVLAKVRAIRKWDEDKGSSKLSEWQIEILDEIEEHVNAVLIRSE